MVDYSNDEIFNGNKVKSKPNQTESFADVATKEEPLKNTNTNGNSSSNNININNETTTVPAGNNNNNNNEGSNWGINNDLCPSKKKQNEDSFMDNLNTNRIITNEEVSSAKKIKIEQIEGNLLTNKVAYINAAGLIGGRNAKDGVAVFGISTTNKFKCDMELNYDNSLIDYPYIFTIYYLRESKSYYIRSYSGKKISNRLLFIRLVPQYELSVKQKEIISVGNILFQMIIQKDKSIDVTNLQKADKKNYDSNIKKQITIGRDIKCDFGFPDEKSFSRIQTTIEYNTSKNEWVIYDGTKEKQSTNGTWVFGLHSFPIIDQMVIEVLSAKIKFSFVDKVPS